ncbi:hypothetical protein KJ671_02820 [Patescibacteria group bacterium]|nr:hypothetical protein [Patescibacteria group bacterium]
MPQYNQNTSEHIMRSGKNDSSLPWRLLAFSSFIFLLSILSFFALSIGYSNYLNSQIDFVDKGIQILVEKVSPESQSIFINLYPRLSNFLNLSNNHIYTNQVFPLLEKITNPNIYYSNFDLNIPDNKLVLSGLAKDFNSLSMQLYSYDRNQMITNYILNQSRLIEDVVSFRITLFLSPKLFMKASNL